MKSYKIILTLFFVFFSSVVFGKSGDDLLIGYINMSKAINLSDEGKRSRKFLEPQSKQIDKLKSDLKGIEAEGAQIRNNIMLNEASKAKKIEEIIKSYQLQQRKIIKAENEFREDELRHTQKIFKDLKKVVEKLAKKKKYDFVVESIIKQSIIFTKYKMIDITEEAIEAYNKSQTIK
jgi:Skp family chaperone for outer membrane proteins